MKLITNINSKKIILIVSTIILILIIVKIWPRQFFCPTTNDNSESVIKINEDLFLLSTKGSSRATAYANMSKVIFIDSICVISWLGIDEGKFKPVVAVYDLKTKKVINRYIFDESFDNHGVPSLAVDNEKIIHLFYYPHSAHKIKYKTGKLTTNNQIIWECQENIGDPNLTYPNPIFHKDKGLFLFARKTPNIPGPNPLVSYGFFKPVKDKNVFNDLLISSTSGYAAFSSRVLISNEKIQLLTRYHENSSKNFYGQTQTISYIESQDNGVNWQRDDKNKINYQDKGLWSWESLKLNNLITSNKGSIIDKGGLEKGNVLSVIGLYNDNLKNVNAFYLKEDISDSKMIEAIRNNKNGYWAKSYINNLIYPQLKGHRFVAPTGNLIVQDSIILFSGVLQDDTIKRDIKSISQWGHKSNSVVLFTKEKNKYKILIEFTSSSNCVWFPYIKLKGNNLVLIFTKKSADIKLTNNDTTNETEVFLFHTKLDELLNKKHEKLILP